MLCLPCHIARDLGLLQLGHSCDNYGKFKSDSMNMENEKHEKSRDLGNAASGSHWKRGNVVVRDPSLMRYLVRGNESKRNFSPYGYQMGLGKRAQHFEKRLDPSKYFGVVSRSKSPQFDSESKFKRGKWRYNYSGLIG